MTTAAAVRVRAAMTNTGYTWPFNKRLTINGKPADDSGYTLAERIAVLAAAPPQK